MSLISLGSLAIVNTQGGIYLSHMERDKEFRTHNVTLHFLHRLTGGLPKP
jgi:hypothetical protein